nr:MAG TPA: hypothetical protein [Bacteriophage sp.]
MYHFKYTIPEFDEIYYERKIAIERAKELAKQKLHNSLKERLENPYGWWRNAYIEAVETQRPIEYIIRYSRNFSQIYIKALLPVYCPNRSIWEAVIIKIK